MDALHAITIGRRNRSLINTSADILSGMSHSLLSALDLKSRKSRAINLADFEQYTDFGPPVSKDLFREGAPMLVKIYELTLQCV